MSENSATSADSYVQQDSVNENTSGVSNANVAGFELWMVFAGGSVLSAFVAINMGQQKSIAAVDRHNMSGAVMRRNGAVNAFAEGAFANDIV